MLEAFADLDRRLRAEGLERRALSGQVAAQDEAMCVMLARRGCRPAGLAYRPYVTAGVGCSRRERYRPVAAWENAAKHSSSRLGGMRRIP